MGYIWGANWYWSWNERGVEFKFWIDLNWTFARVRHRWTCNVTRVMFHPKCFPSYVVEFMTRRSADRKGDPTLGRAIIPSSKHQQTHPWISPRPSDLQAPPHQLQHPSLAQPPIQRPHLPESQTWGNPKGLWSQQEVHILMEQFWAA